MADDNQSSDPQAPIPLLPIPFVVPPVAAEEFHEIYATDILIQARVPGAEGELYVAMSPYRPNEDRATGGVLAPAGQREYRKALFVSVAKHPELQAAFATIVAALPALWQELLDDEAALAVGESQPSA